MEPQPAFSATSVLIFISTILILLSLAKVNKRSKAQNLPPGPWKLPIIGSMHHLVTGSLPHHTLSKLSKRYGPLMHLQLGEISAIVVSSPHIAKTFLKTHEFAFLGRPSILATDVMSYNKSEIAFSPYSDHWRQMRRICVTELLSNKSVHSFRSIREDEVSNLVAFIRKSVGSPIDLTAQFFSLTSSITCRAAFGEKILGQSSVISLVNEATSLMGIVNLGDIFPSAKFLAVVSGMKSKVENIFKKVDKTFDDIIQKRQEYNELFSKSGKEKHEKEDLLDVFLRLHQEKKQEFPITYNNIKAGILEMFMAGTETTATAIEWAMSEMIQNPRVMEKAQSELRLSLNEIKTVKERDIEGLPYLKLIIKETLRLHPPGPLLVPRECTETCEINGYTIPIKTKVLFNAWAIGRDPDFWEDAEKFIPERFEKNMMEYNGKNFEYIPFGAGRRICPGVSFSLAIVEPVLANLIYHFNWKLSNQIKPEELDMTEVSGIAARRRNPLCLIANFNEATRVEN